MVKSKPSVGIVNIAGGNIRSLYAAIDKKKFTVADINDLDSRDEFDTIVFPGVGNIAKLSSLMSSAKDSMLERHIRRNGNIVGICMGFQILSEYSLETHQATRALSLLDGHINRLQSLQCQVGWNTVSFDSSSRFYQFDNCNFYFNHGYSLCGTDTDFVTGYTKVNKLETIPSVVEKGNIVGFQFHPEKSQHVGINLLNQALNN